MNLALKQLVEKAGTCYFNNRCCWGTNQSSNKHIFSALFRNTLLIRVDKLADLVVHTEKDPP